MLSNKAAIGDCSGSETVQGGRLSTVGDCPLSETVHGRSR